jgi:hypothetical protein
LPGNAVESVAQWYLFQLLDAEKVITLRLMDIDPANDLVSSTAEYRPTRNVVFIQFFLAAPQHGRDL